MTNSVFARFWRSLGSASRLELSTIIDRYQHRRGGDDGQVYWGEAGRCEMKDALYGVYGASGCGRGVMPLARKQLQQAGVAAEHLVFVDNGAGLPEQLNGQRRLSCV